MKEHDPLPLRRQERISSARNETAPVFIVRSWERRPCRRSCAGTHVGQASSLPPLFQQRTGVWWFGAHCQNPRYLLIRLIRDRQDACTTILKAPHPLPPALRPPTDTTLPCLRTSQAEQHKPPFCRISLANGCCCNTPLAARSGWPKRLRCRLRAIEKPALRGAPFHRQTARSSPRRSQARPK